MLRHVESPSGREEAETYNLEGRASEAGAGQKKSSIVHRLLYAIGESIICRRGRSTYLVAPQGDPDYLGSRKGVFKNKRFLGLTKGTS